MQAKLLNSVNLSGNAESQSMNGRNISVQKRERNLGRKVTENAPFAPSLSAFRVDKPIEHAGNPGTNIGRKIADTGTKKDEIVILLPGLMNKDSPAGKPRSNFHYKSACPPVQQ